MISKGKAPVRISFGTCGDTNYYTDLIGWGNGINATIDLYSYCEIHKRNDNKVVFRSLEAGKVEEFDSIEDVCLGERTLNLAKIVARHYGNSGIEVVTHTDAPLESGLGGSAAHCIALIRAFDNFNGIRRNEDDVARLAYQIERNVAGIEGGYQDQWASAYGGINYMEFVNGSVNVTPIKLNGRDLEFLEESIILVYVPRDGEGSTIHHEQRERSQKSIPIMIMKRENIQRLKDCMEKRNFGEIGSILHFDWKIKKQLAPGISNSSLDRIYDTALNAGALGGRFIGSGAGGSALFFCPGKREEVLRALEKLGAKQIRYRFERRHQSKDYKVRINERILEHTSMMETMLIDENLMENIDRLTNSIVECYKNDGKVIIFGNGGSAADAQHIAAELVNRFKIERPMLNAIALTVNSSVLTAIANDSSYDDVFTRQIEFLASPRDIVIGISTSGKAVSVLRGLEKAKEIGATVVYFTGKDGGMISQLCDENGIIDISLKLPHHKTERVQEGHILIGHVVCELVENELYGYDR